MNKNITTILNALQETPRILNELILEIDPQFGTKEKFKEMVDLLHANGIRIMLDAVFNHAGFHHKAFADIREHGSNSSYRDWFHLRNFPLVTEPMPNYDTFAFVPEMPKFNTERDNQIVEEKIPPVKNVALFYV